MIKLIRARAAQWRRQPDVAYTLLVLWGLFIVYATMLPFDFSASSAQIEKKLAQLWFHPLGGGSWHDVYSNVLLFMPWGLLQGIWRARRGTRFVSAMIQVLFSGAILSGSVEFLQLFAPARSTSLINLITNTFGGCVGGLLGWPWARWAWPRLSVRVRQVISTRPLAGCSLAALVVLLIAGFSPFTMSLAPSDPRTALERVRLDPFDLLVESTSPGNAWTRLGELLTWTLAGGLFALAALESGQRGSRAIGCAIALAGGVSFASQASHVLIAGRQLDMTAVVIAGLGSAAGSVPVACAPEGDPRRFIPPALLVWGLAVAVGAWRPGRFAWPDPPYWRNEWIVPFWSYFNSCSLADLADVVGQALAFIPLGALLAARSWRQSLIGVLLVGLGSGSVLEVGQVFLPDRSADISDALSAAAGAGLGWGIWRWGEWARTSPLGVARYRVRR